MKSQNWLHLRTYIEKECKDGKWRKYKRTTIVRYPVTIPGFTKAWLTIVDVKGTMHQIPMIDLSGHYDRV